MEKRIERIDTYIADCGLEYRLVELTVNGNVSVRVQIVNLEIDEIEMQIVHDTLKEARACFEELTAGM